MALFVIPARALAELADMPVGRIELVDPAGRQDADFAHAASRIAPDFADVHAPLSGVAFDAYIHLIGVGLLRGHSNLTFERTSEGAVGDPTGACGARSTTLEAHLAEDLGLAEIAAAVQLGTTQFTTLLRVATGEPPHRWLMRRRFERACELLTDSRHSITEIAHACGFASSQHLATVFQRRIGVTPTHYRRDRLA